MSDADFSNMDESQIRLNDGNGDSIPLFAIKSQKGEVARIASSTAPRNTSQIDFGAFYDQVADHGGGLSMLKTTEIQSDRALSQIPDVLEHASLMLGADREFDLLPLEILDHDAERKIAWLLTVRSSGKVSLLEDGVPAGISVDESIMRYKRYWYLLPSDPEQKPSILFRGHTFED
jgi:hypothetical protein